MRVDALSSSELSETWGGSELVMLLEETASTPIAVAYWTSLLDKWLFEGIGEGEVTVILGSEVEGLTF